MYDFILPVTRWNARQISKDAAVRWCWLQNIWNAHARTQPARGQPIISWSQRYACFTLRHRDNRLQNRIGA